jgi:SAM-dependent methyltransferase
MSQLPSYREALRTELLDEAFVRLVCSAPRGSDDAPGSWTKVTARPVTIKGDRLIQFTYSDGRREEAHNAPDAEDALRRLNDLLQMPFRRIHLQSTKGDLHIRFARKGRVLISRAKPSSTVAARTDHDRAKSYVLAPESAQPLFHALGITDAAGGIRPSMQAKFRQVNEFLRIVRDLMLAGPPRRVSRDAPPSPTFRVVDFGCGSAHLTFALHHFLNAVLGIPSEVLGVDREPEPIAKCSALANQIGAQGLKFRVSTIAGLELETPPDMAICLHACDEATDEALAKAVAWGVPTILAAPCCQHELHRRLQSDTFRAVLAHGILRERLADILTDAFRAQALRVMGYRSSVTEFVSPEHTAKNLLIRAEKCLAAGQRESVDAYLALRSYWGVAPALEGLLGERLGGYLARQP